MDDRWLREEALPIIRSVARRIARGAWVNDYDDLVQEGILAIWREGVRTPQLIAICARRRMFDAQRRVYGRVGSKVYDANLRMRRLDAPAPDPDPDRNRALTDLLAAHETGYDDVDASLLLPPLDDPSLGLTAREQEILRRQAEGETLRVIGASWGVTESRACQVSLVARAKLARTLEDDP